MNKEIKFQNALTKAGYLKKQSPNMLKVYQNRYYSFRDKGRALIWFKKQPSNIESRPKGVIMVSDIIKVVPDQADPTIFFIEYPQRIFKLKASSAEDRDEWISALLIVIEYLKTNEEKPDRMSSPTKKEGWRWENASGEVTKKIQIQNQEIFINDYEVNEEQLSPEKGREILKNKGIVHNIGNEDLMDRIVMGFLYKKGKYSQITQYRLRWFFMVSEFNLRDTNDLNSISFAELPSWIRPDIMYYFKPQDDSEPKGSVCVKNVTDIIMQVNQKPYRMIVNVDQEDSDRRQYHFGSRYMIEIRKWENAIKLIRQRFQDQLNENQRKFNNIVKEVTRFEEQVILQGKSIYFVIKDTVAILFQSKEDQDLNKSRFIRYDQVLKYTSQQKFLNIIVSPTPCKIQFKNEIRCIQAFNSFKVAIESMSTKTQQLVNTIQSNFPEKQMLIDKKNQDDDHSYLGKKIHKRMSKLKNLYSMQAMEIQAQEQSKQREQGFWARISKMFCGGRSE